MTRKRGRPNRSDVVDEPGQDSLGGTAGTEPGDGAGAVRKSRSQQKRDAQVFDRLALRLVQEKPEVLAGLSLDGELREAVAEGQRLTKNARSRQLRLIAKLMRERGTGTWLDELNGVRRGRRSQAAEEQANEHWRERLLADAQGAVLAEFGAAYPQADCTLLAALLVEARGHAQTPKGLTARRRVLRFVRASRAESGEPVEVAEP